MEWLQLEHTGIGAEGFKLLLPLLQRQSSSLTWLSVENCGLGPDGATAMASIIDSFQHLHELNVARNRLGDSGLMQDALQFSRRCRGAVCESSGWGGMRLQASHSDTLKARAWCCLICLLTISDPVAAQLSQRYFNKRATFARCCSAETSTWATPARQVTTSFHGLFSHDMQLLVTPSTPFAPSRMCLWLVCA
jgi:hypothetical protein